MLTGFRIWEVPLKAEGHLPMEVYPAGCFYRLNGNRWPAKKTTLEGILDRVRLLRACVELPDDIELWSTMQ